MICKLVININYQGLSYKKVVSKFVFKLVTNGENLETNFFDS